MRAQGDEDEAARETGKERPARWKRTEVSYAQVGEKCIKGEWSTVQTEAERPSKMKN